MTESRTENTPHSLPFVGPRSGGAMCQPEHLFFTNARNVQRQRPEETQAAIHTKEWEEPSRPIGRQLSVRRSCSREECDARRKVFCLTASTTRRRQRWTARLETQTLTYLLFSLNPLLCWKNKQRNYLNMFKMYGHKQNL